MLSAKTAILFIFNTRRMLLFVFVAIIVALLAIRAF